MIHRTYILCLSICLFSFLSVESVFAQVSSFQTTRMKSTAGAGVAALLMDESSILNPAPLAFFNSSALFYQRSNADIEFTADEQNGPFSTSTAKSNAFIASDSKGGASGAISYINQEEQEDSRRTIGLTLAKNVGKKSAFGVTYKFMKEELTETSGAIKEVKYKQAVFGISHVVHSNFSIGLVAIDPFRERPEETRALVGLQYVFEDFLSVMLDAGADYYKNLNDTTILRGALQLKIYQDFFLRFGSYSDKGLGEKGTGFGIGWVQPKLVVEFALKNSSFASNEFISQANRDNRESSFSLAYRF